MNDASVEFSQAAAAAAVDLSVADGVLPDRGTEIVADLVQSLDDHLTRLDAVDDVELPLAEQVDLEIVRGRVAALRFDLVDVARHRWDPLQWSPIPALTVLTEAEFSTVDARVTSAKSRLAQVPEFLTHARETLGEMSGIHVAAAMEQLRGFPGTAGEIAQLAAEVGCDVGQELDEAGAAISGHLGWLNQRLAGSQRDPRLGVRLYSAAMWHHLDEQVTPVNVLAAAEDHLDVVTTQLRECAAEYRESAVTEQGVVRAALDDIGRQVLPNLHPQGAAAQKAGSPDEHPFRRSEVFIEGWAVYAEQSEQPSIAMRMQQLHRQARIALWAILDARVHGGDIVEPEAVDLLIRRGFLDAKEAEDAWQRALLTATVLPTAFVGYQALASIAADLHVLHPDWSVQQVNALMMSQGSPGPRHLRVLLGL